MQAADLDTSPLLQPYTGVTVYTINAAGNRVGYSAGVVDGESAGRVLDVECPWPTQQMADALYNKVCPEIDGIRSGYRYQPYDAAGALLDPAAELGDGVTIGGVYSILATQSTDHASGAAADIGAARTDDIDDEYPYKNPIERSIAALGQASASLQIDVDAIIGQVTDDYGRWTMLTINSQGVVITGSSGGAVEINGGQLKAGTVTADDIVANALISAPTIYGAEYLSSGGKSKLELAEADPYGTQNERPALIWSNAGVDSHQIAEAYDIAGQILRLDMYGDYVASYWGSDEFAYKSLKIATNVELESGILLSSASYGYVEPTQPGLANGQLYIQLIS